MRGLPVILFVCFGLLTAGAQTNISDILRSGNLAGGYASMINFAAEPDISGAKLKIDSDDPDDDTLRVFKLPLRHEFKLNNSSWKPIIQSTLSRFTLDSAFQLTTNENINAKWTA